MNRPVDENKRCFTYCGEERCDCGAAIDHIVFDVQHAFGLELAKIMGADPPKRIDPG